MARGYTTRKLEVWTLHVRTAEGPADYRAFFSELAALPARDRTWETGEKAVAIPVLELRNRRIRFTAYEGPRGQPIVYDTGDATERVQPLERDEIVATRTHGLIDLASREVIIEYNHRGAKASDIASVLGVAGRRALDDDALWVELNPKVDASFVEAVDAFDRIRVAGLRVARPNPTWEDWDDNLAASAEDSDAGTVQAEYTARRSSSLSKTSGIVPFIKQRVSEAKAGLKNAFVTGVRNGETAETTVTLGDHKEHVRINVRLDPDGHVDEADITTHIDRYDRERRPKRR